MIETYTLDNFREKVAEAEDPLMLDFTSRWCMPCQVMDPMIEHLSDLYDGRVRFGRIDTDHDPEIASLFHVVSLPAFVFLKDGRAADMAVGVQPMEALKEKLDRLLEGCDS